MMVRLTLTSPTSGRRSRISAARIFSSPPSPASRSMMRQRSAGTASKTRSATCRSVSSSVAEAKSVTPTFEMSASRSPWSLVAAAGDFAVEPERCGMTVATSKRPEVCVRAASMASSRPLVVCCAESKAMVASGSGASSSMVVAGSCRSVV